jgi:glycerol-3-phosphate dehydrogenase (NAD(P)+)
MNHAGILGGGAWGTALAQVCARAGRDVTLWAREPEVAAAINDDHVNPFFGKGAPLEPSIRATTDLSGLAACDFLLAVTPAQYLRATLEAFAPHARPGLPVALCCKGVEQGTLKLMTEVLVESLPASAPAVLSGPSFAEEVTKGLPTAVTLACADEGLGRALVEAIATPVFRPYLAHDMVGAEAGAAVKNVLAIACGIIEGRGLGRGAHAALITRGFAELTRFAVALGAEPETVRGLCGLGDLVLTCSSPLSRNMRFGLALAEGRSVAEALDSLKPAVVEGVFSAPAVTALATRLDVEMPICEAVAAIVAGEISVDEAILRLLSRPLKSER